MCGFIAGFVFFAGGIPADNQLACAHCGNDGYLCLVGHGSEEASVVMLAGRTNLSAGITGDAALDTVGIVVKRGAAFVSSVCMGTGFDAAVFMLSDCGTVPGSVTGDTAVNAGQIVLFGRAAAFYGGADTALDAVGMPRSLW